MFLSNGARFASCRCSLLIEYRTVPIRRASIVYLQAAVSALKQFPAVNAVIDGDDILYRDYVDISIAVGTAKVESQTKCRGHFVIAICEL